MKKWNLRSYLAGVITTVLLLGLALPSLAAAIQQQLTVTYKNIQIYVDGQKITPTDANGNIVEPFVSNGTTYLPVRAVGEALGKTVEWDGTTNTVYIGAKPGYATTNEDLVWFEDISEGREYPDRIDLNDPEIQDMLTDAAEQDYVDHINQELDSTISVNERWVEPSGANRAVSAIGIQNIMASGSASAEVSDWEILRYCMPSLPDDFMSNPASGTYDGIRVKVEDGKILLAYSDLKEKGFAG